MLIICIRALEALAVQEQKHFVYIKAFCKYLHMWGEVGEGRKKRGNKVWLWVYLLDIHALEQQLLKIFTFSFKNYVQKCCHHFEFEFISILSSLHFAGMLQLNIWGWKVIELEAREGKFNFCGMHDSSRLQAQHLLGNLNIWTTMTHV